MDERTVGERLMDRDAWIRLLHIVLFAVALYVAMMVLAVTAAAQFLFRLVAGEPLAALATFGAGLAAWTREVIAFLTFAAEDKPFPFAPWPGKDGGVLPSDET